MIMRTVGAVGRRVVEMHGLVTGQPEDHFSNGCYPNPIVLYCVHRFVEPAEWPWTSPAKREPIEEINTAIGREAFAEAQTDELVFQHGTNQ
jgi:hypothetical protein